MFNRIKKSLSRIRERGPIKAHHLPFIAHHAVALVFAVGLGVGFLVLADVHPLAQTDQQTQQTDAAGGKAWAWGGNARGQLGDGTNTERSTPVQVNNLSDVTAVAGGEFHSLVLKSNGTVWAWGGNARGQLGDGTNTERSTPVQVNNLSGASAVAGGGGHSLALKEDGTVWAWGANHWGDVNGLTPGGGQLGDGTNTDRSIPVQVNNLTDVTAVAGGYFHSLALKNDGTVWAWGNNEGGQLGDGTTQRSTPVQVNNLSGASAIAAGGSHSLALKEDGTVWAWGGNGNGQLGDSTNTERSTPVQVNNLTDVIAVAGGEFHSLALKEDGTVWAWGKNAWGQLGLGNGNSEDRSTPEQVANLSGATAIAAPGHAWGHYSLALKEDGTVWAWGMNDVGQLGDGTNTSRDTPGQVANLPDATAIAAGSYHSLALAFSDPSDTTPPTVNSTYPTNEQRRIPKSANVTATFSEAMNAGTITAPGNFTLEFVRQGKGTPITADISYDSNTNTVTLDPKDTLRSGTYRVTIKAGVEDLAGNQLGTDKVWLFSV